MAGDDKQMFIARSLEGGLLLVLCAGCIAILDGWVFSQITFGHFSVCGHCRKDGADLYEVTGTDSF